MKNLMYIVVAFCVATFSFAQESHGKVISANDSLPTSLQNISEINIGNQLSLQEYVEELYINTCKLYHKGAIPAIESGNYDVLLIEKKDGGDRSKFVKSKELNLLNIEDIKEIKYEKSKQTDLMYGSRGGEFGVVVISK